jgi:hypothetical protein
VSSKKAPLIIPSFVDSRSRAGLDALKLRSKPGPCSYFAGGAQLAPTPLLFPPTAVLDPARTTFCVSPTTVTRAHHPPPPTAAMPKSSTGAPHCLRVTRTGLLTRWCRDNHQDCDQARVDQV